MSTKQVFRMVLVFAMLAGLLGFAIPAMAGAGDIVVSYTLPSGQINPGDNFSVPVSIAVTGVQPLTGLQFNMSWNPAYLDLVSVTKGNFFVNCSIISSDFYNAPALNHVAGTMSNYGMAGLGIPAGQGCYNTGSGANSTGSTLVTLNFHAVANGQSAQAISGVIFSDVNSHPYAAYTFPGFSQWVGVAPKLVVQSVAFQPNGGTPPGSNFNAVVTVANQGGNPSLGDTLVVSTDGNSTPVSTNVSVPAIAANGNQQFTVALSMVSGQQSTKVTAAIAAYNTTASNTYSPVSSQGQTPIDATFGAFIKVTPDSSINFGQLALGANHISGGINVQCNTNYEVDVTDANPTNWHMSEWNGTAFVSGGSHLQDPLSVQATGFSIVSTPGGKLLTGTVAGQGAGDAGQTFSLNYAQTLHYNDPLLSAGETYHLVLTWNGFVTA